LELVISSRIKLQESVELPLVVAVMHAHRVAQADESMMREATQAAHWAWGASWSPVGTIEPQLGHLASDT
jgi:hypothetical protein